MAFFLKSKNKNSYVNSTKYENAVLISNNLNTLVFADNNTDINRYFIEPNLCEMPVNTNFVCVDPDGELYNCTEKMLIGAGYKIKTLNLVNIEKSNHYNPFDYFYTLRDIDLFTDWLFLNTQENKRGEDIFWEANEKILLKALVFLLIEYYDKLHLKKNIPTLIKLATDFYIQKPDDENIINTYDYFTALINGWYFDENGKFHLTTSGDIPIGCEHYSLSNTEIENSKTLYYWNKINQISEITSHMAMVSLVDHLSKVFTTTNTSLFEDDDMTLEQLTEEKTALFIITSTDKLNNIGSLLCMQLCQIMHNKKDNNSKSKIAVVDSDNEIVKIFESNSIDEYKNTKLKAEKFAKNISKNIKINEKGSDFILKTSLLDSDNKILNIYTEKYFAYKKLKAIETGCSIVELNSTKVPYQIKFVLSDFCDIGIIPQLDVYMSICNNSSYSFDIIINSLNEFTKQYENNWGIIINNCNTIYFFNSKEQYTLEYISKLLERKANLKQKNSKKCDFIDIDKLKYINNQEFLCISNTEYPYKGKKNNVVYHPNYVFLNDN